MTEKIKTYQQEKEEALNKMREDATQFANGIDIKVKRFAEALRVNFDLLAWNNSDEVIDYTLSEWQKGAENDKSSLC